MSEIIEKRQSSCEKSVLRVERSFWVSLPILERLKMHFHLFICKNCKAYEKDSRLLHKLLCYLKKAEKVEPLNDLEKIKLKKALE